MENFENLYLSQVHSQESCPADATLAYRRSLNKDASAKDELHRELEKGYQSFLAGDTKPADEVFASLREEFDL
ncbi:MULTISPECIES: hypothetical protein [Aerococcus]|uniref:Uncharacterized protein n=1 Tax=Aerococcus loyolae TaxID=2976809 RepID=A0ABT4C1P6_9LACT|nr:MULTISPECIES: hypothetical protein [Aerococcus]MCY3026305.1 hypothetical protein [Aerococcus loyolae]MCY3028165.1 hypothetical protein [Aerococcus loyolae]MCY3028859.1 hypothetical protein [Aerococcus loyolae]MDK6232258.1 hypothetical protein [Aerococcus urinae]MDK6257491.1 hypothetical protein [Aerococcus urinae]